MLLVTAAGAHSVFLGVGVCTLSRHWSISQLHLQRELVAVAGLGIERAAEAAVSVRAVVVVGVGVEPAVVVGCVLG